MSQSLTPERASVVACDLEAGAEGEQGSTTHLVATVQLGDERFRYRIDSSRSWRPLGTAEVTVDRQRLIDFALWSYLREFTGEIDARLMHGKASRPSAT